MYSASRASRVLSTTLTYRCSVTRLTFTPHRAFHSPFAVLSSSPLTTPPAHDGSSTTTTTTTSTTTTTTTNPYEKQGEHSPEPHVSHSGARTYVVSEADPAHTPYAVPSGAYPTSRPYQNPDAAPPPENMSHSSSSASPAHPATTTRVPKNEDGVGESSAVRYRSAPGEMGRRGGSNSGLDLMDATSTKSGSHGELADRNQPPLMGDAERISEKGVKDAWKERK